MELPPLRGIRNTRGVAIAVAFSAGTHCILINALLRSIQIVAVWCQLFLQLIHNWLEPLPIFEPLLVLRVGLLGLLRLVLGVLLIGELVSERHL